MRSRTPISSPSTTITVPTTPPPPVPSVPPPNEPNDQFLNPIRPSIRGRLENSAKRLSLIITEDIFSKFTAMHNYRGGRTRHARDPITIPTANAVIAAQQASQPPPPSPTRRPRSASRKSSRRLSRFGSFKEAGIQIPAFLELRTHEIQRKFAELDSRQYARKNGSDPGYFVNENPSALRRNRFSNIQPWENNRIHLRVPAGANDYVNASPISLASADGSTKRWIATQGPLDGQFHVFWRMVWQEVRDTAVIIMLTPFKDNDLRFASKCSQYFPLVRGAEPMIVHDDESGDNFEARLWVEEYEEDVTVKCYMRKIIMQVGYKQKTIWHFQFDSWPDHGTPKETASKRALVQLIHKANSLNPDPENPIFVHCSAGVGRSGTYIALDHFIGEISKGLLPLSSSPDLDPVLETVDLLRQQRMYMVQSQDQLKFIYRTLADVWTNLYAPQAPPMPPLTPQHSQYGSQLSQGSTQAADGSQEAAYTPRTPTSRGALTPGYAPGTPTGGYFGSRRPGLRSGESFLGRD
ncbi:hypothetical protein BJ508DRAFT_166211 [Ascobolus immersus RN42]|uniref:Phosphatases II n=1 Tax=Ascobolus immersus RN42 TaxID=1160509 RepID=A0A3N4INE3_ASCIM|nr:hypothetical protein BJ508DRAFT_166211 [Ascobolus immersus RN42]